MDERHLRAYGSHPAYLRVGDKPVVFVYSVPRLRVADWSSVVAGVRGSGPKPLLIGDGTRSVWLPSFDGQFDYASNRFAIPDIGGSRWTRDCASARITCSGTRANAACGPQR